MAKDGIGFDWPFIVVALTSAIIATPLWIAAADNAPALLTGSQLMDACKRSDAYGGYCGGYVAGMADSMTAKRPHPAACFPHRVAAEQLVNVVKLYLSQHPEKSHFGAFEGIFLALQSAFPCAPSL
jgi:hypothetical protein